MVLNNLRRKVSVRCYLDQAGLRAGLEGIILIVSMHVGTIRI